KETTINTDLLIFLTARIIPADGGVDPIDEIILNPRPSIPNPTIDMTRKNSQRAAAPSN
ncbi:MAG: hypothetical protein JKX97_09050, partial [Candidatus Lindowbacteria bacterium]|nr:hypothetical protein [Candidatus Lindowbacteria bacterium]